MEALREVSPALAPYHTAILCLAVLCLVALIQSFLSAPLAFIKEEQTPGAPLNFDHSKLSFRVLRTYGNTVENLPAFGFSLIVAIIGGASPWAVNGLAALYLAFRLVFWVVYYSGIGKVAGGPRTLAYVGGLLANMSLAALAIYALL